MSEPCKHLLLVGGGHAHVAVLADWIKSGLPCERATLLTPHRMLRYSGMVPGWIAGQYARDEGLVDVGALAARAGVQLLLGPCTGIDPQAGWVKTGGGQVIEYDVVSLDTGGVGRSSRILGKAPKLLDIRPIDRFVERLEKYPLARRIAVVGGGAGGVEIAFALNNRTASPAQVTLVTGAEGLLPTLSSAVRRKVKRELARQNITVIAEDARLEDGQLATASGKVPNQDLIIAALGSGAPAWPAAGGLAVDEDGFIAVDQYQRSISHPNVFATGDVASRQDRSVPHSGVHAVMAGPHLAENLRQVMRGDAPTSVYKPRPASLYLLSTGDGSAILSYGPLAASGRWASKLKAAIDKRWISKYANLANSV
ncbi:FAD-dependent oxidoreductase [Erythrobacter sp. SCSIO 43205]|uniref:FAD-dependent oxidoreductase n=1 Tax=Erythrobacter sp. SCSIO 43205 TaxID=2779361 RepID=UPI001CA7EC05|nr:FAD-dependent oxidoreductase [Erythrobacter sp. SCSIO 43205]UAB78029.1 FAD-dependent oxidoreductase [Erythrobacter sp. SCSIO 43205]